MPERPTYEELKQRMLELEKLISDHHKTENTTRENERFLAAIFEHIPNMIFVKEAKELRYLRFNKAGEELLGYPRKDMIGKNDYDFFPKDEADFFIAKDREVLNSGILIDIPEETVHTKHKGVRILHTKKIPILDENGQPIYLLGISEDITERRLAEKALEKRILALTRPLDAQEGIAFEDLFNLDDIQHLQDKFADATKVASIITRPDGTPITKPSNFCRLCKDIIRKTDKGLRNCYKSDAVLGKPNLEGPTIQPCLSGGLWDAGAGISVGGNHIANWLIGQVRDEMQSEEKMRLYAREIGADEQAVVNAFNEVPSMSKKQFSQVSEALFTLADQLSTTAYQNVQQARFISRLKESEEEQRRLQSQLDQAQKMEAIGRLAGGVAHDFNNMLSVIIGHTELALMQFAPNDPLHADLQEILIAGKRSADLTRQLLAFARKQTVAPKVLDLNQVVTGMTRMLERLIGEDINLVWIPGENVWPVKVDPSQIDQILANLCVNARDAISDVGKITIETANASFDEDDYNDQPEILPGEYVSLIVSDNGCGMDSETLKRLFEPFFTTKELGKGTGLGLATVYGTVKQNSGFINVYSEGGKGTTFRIYLPRHYSTSFDMQESKPGQTTLGGNETILIVEDEPAILQLTTKILQQLGYNVMTAKSPNEAIRLTEEYSAPIHLLVTDVIMPEMNGRDLVDKLISSYPDLKTLFMSGYTANAIAHHGVLKEGVNFIQKPFPTKKLAAKVREALDMDKGRIDE